MSRRNIWLTFSEWELITNELSYQNYNPFRIDDRELKEWKDTIKHCEDMGYSSTQQHCFKRIDVYHLINHLKTPQTINNILREYWRETDFHRLMDYTHEFIGFVINYIDDVDVNTTMEEWEDIRNQMKNEMGKSDKRYWFQNDLIKLYQQVSNQLVAA